MVVKERIERLMVPADGSFFLLGPRGTGKSTWLRQRFPDAAYLDLLEEARYQRYLADPGLFAAEVRAVPTGKVVVVDEVQRLPNLLHEVHRAIEARGQRFVLCGSSARKLRARGVNLLAGRALQRCMHPFLPEELGPVFDLEAALRLGCLPVVLASPSPAETLGAYVQLYLKEEIQAEALVRNLPGFARFLPVAALFHAQVLNASGLARDAGVARTTVLGYLEILEETLLAFRLPAFEGKLRVRERRHPKLYFCDPGLVRGIQRRFDPPAPGEAGHLLEGFLAQVLRAYRDTRNLFDDWSYWASGGSRRTEVDFLLWKGESLVALEVKAGSGAPGSDELRGLRAVVELGPRRRVLVYRGPARLRTEDGIEVLPVADLLAELAAGSLMGA